MVAEKKQISKKIQKNIDDYFHLLESDKINLMVDIFYNFYIIENILNENENVFWYDKENGGFDIHDESDIKECIKNDIESSISKEQHEDTEPISISYSKNLLYQNLKMTLEQYGYNV